MSSACESDLGSFLHKHKDSIEKFIRSQQGIMVFFTHFILKSKKSPFLIYVIY